MYHYDPSRGEEVPMRLLDGFTGFLQTDAYGGYGAVCRKNKLVSVGCMVHARRKFDEALKAQSGVDKNQQKSTLAATAIKKIQALYRIKRETRLLSDEQRWRVRQARSLPLLKELRHCLDDHLYLVPPRSALGKAMQYLDKQWDKLTVYTTDGRSGPLRPCGRLVEWLRRFAAGPFFRSRWLWECGGYPPESVVPIGGVAGFYLVPVHKQASCPRPCPSKNAPRLWTGTT